MDSDSFSTPSKTRYSSSGTKLLVKPHYHKELSERKHLTLQLFGEQYRVHIRTYNYNYASKAYTPSPGGVALDKDITKELTLCLDKLIQVVDQNVSIV
jgi:hypothetical protein